MRAAQIHLARTGWQIRAQWDHGRAVTRRERVVRAGAGGLISVKRAQLWCWMALERLTTLKLVLVGGGVAPRGWWHIFAKLFQCLKFPAWEQPLSPAWGRLRFPAWEHLPVPCLGTFVVPAWDACQFPAWERLPVPCLGALSSVHALPGHACSPCLGCLPVPCLGTLASSLPGNVCQCPAWARFAVPALDALQVPCLGTFANLLTGHVCQSLPGTASSLPGNAICWDPVPS